MVVQSKDQSFILLSDCLSLLISDSLQRWSYVPCPGIVHSHQEKPGLRVTIPHLSSSTEHQSMQVGGLISTSNIMLETGVKKVTIQIQYLMSFACMMNEPRPSPFHATLPLLCIHCAIMSMVDANQRRPGNETRMRLHFRINMSLLHILIYLIKTCMYTIHKPFHPHLAYLNYHAYYDIMPS